MMRTWAGLASISIAVACVVAAPAAPAGASPEPRSSVPDRPIRWLAAGDSYSSGEGLSDASETTCQRADRSGVHTSAAWAEVARESLSRRELPLEPGVGPAGGFDFVACTGAVTQDLFDDTSRNNKKEWDAADNGRFDLVTFSFGGNNIGFERILKQCVGWSLSGLGAALAGGARGGVVGGVQSWLNLVGCPAEQDIRDAIAGLGSGGNDYNGHHLPPLDEFYSRVARDVVTRGGNVVVVGYPAFVEDPQFWPIANRVMGHCQGIRERDASMLRRVAGALNQTIGQAVEEANHNPQGVHFTFVDVNTGSPDAGIAHGDQRLFEPNVGVRHNLCAAEPWLNGVATGFTTGTIREQRSFHPTQEGHNKEGVLVAEVIRGLEWADLGPRQDTRAGLPVGWHAVGDSTFAPGEEAGSGTITTSVIWSGGLVHDAMAGCDYRVETDARMVQIGDPGGTLSGFGVVARAALSGSSVSAGHGLQYESTLGRVRDVDYSHPDDAPNKAFLTDDDWHHIAVEVVGTTYRSEVDGEVVFTGTTSAGCAGAPWLRVWQAKVEVRKLTVTELAAPTPTPVSSEESGNPLPVEAWTVVGGTTLTPSADGGFVLQASSVYWSGARATAPSCDYRLSGEGRAIAGHGYGLVARADFDDGGAAINGHGVQYDPEGGGYRDVEFPEVEQAPTTTATTDDDWHRIAIEVAGDQYRSFIDGRLVFAGTTDAVCGELYLRVWRGTSELRNLRVQPLSPPAPTASTPATSITVGAADVVRVRLSQVDDRAEVWAGDGPHLVAVWGHRGVEPTWIAIGHRPGDSEWADVTSQLPTGTSSLHVRLTNDAICCYASLDVDVEVAGTIVWSDHFEVSDSTAGIKHEIALAIERIP
jgi:hypothetical protein